MISISSGKTVGSSAAQLVGSTPDSRLRRGAGGEPGQNQQMMSACLVRLGRINIRGESRAGAGPVVRAAANIQGAMDKDPRRHTPRRCAR